jgi:predicted PurR-regulated permease PerM
MKREYVLITLFLFISAVLFYLFFELIIPFFAPIIWAAVFAVLFYPLYERLQKRIKRKGLCALIMCMLVLVLIIGPLGYLTVALIGEATNAIEYVNALYRSGELNEILTFDLPWVEVLKERLSQYYDLSKIDLDVVAKDAANELSKIVVTQTSTLLKNGVKLGFYFVLMFFTLYYFFKDGTEVVKKIRRLLPLTPTQVNATFDLLHDVIQATMYGGVTVALIQGLLGGLLFWAVGIPSAVFWGSMMAFLSVVPVLGAFLVYIPAGLILIVGGSWIKGLIVIVVGTVVISQIDNVLRPYLIAGKTSIHPLLLFFSIIGGIAAFGLLGIVIGPLIAAGFLTLLKIFEFKLHPEAGVPSAETAEG